MKTYAAEKPSLEDISHHGVKGMQWGVRKAHPSSSEIHGARSRQAARQKSAVKAPTAKGRAAASRDHQTNEDRVTAARMTLGEKTTAALLGGPVGLVVIAANSSRRRAVARNVDNQRMTK